MTGLVGKRIELHPACDLWMRGARFGTVVAAVRKHKGRERVRVKLDKLARPVIVAVENLEVIS